MEVFCELLILFCDSLSEIMGWKHPCFEVNPCYQARHCQCQFDATLFPDMRPITLDLPYYVDSDLPHHYPNLYDFRRAEAINKPGPMRAPYTRPVTEYFKTRPPYMHEANFRRTGVKCDWLSKWGEARYYHRYTNPASVRPIRWRCCRCKMP